MKFTNLRQDAANSVMLKIDGEEFRIHGDPEISLHEAQKILPQLVRDSTTTRELRDNLRRYNRTFSGAAPRKNPTSTSTEVRSPTKTSTQAHTAGNSTVTVTGGAGDGDTTVTVTPQTRRNNKRK